MRLARAIAVWVCLLGGCAPQYPGEALGSFDVTGHLEANACGAAAVPALDPLRFAVELRVRGAEAFWRRPDFPVVSGSARDGTYRFRTQARIVALAGDPDPDFGHPGCTLLQTETVEVTIEGTDLDAGSPDAGPTTLTLTGTNAIDFTPEPGSDCAPLASAAGGPFLALPCGLDYALEGTASGNAI